MDLYCVMGNPVEHGKSPWIHTRFAELTGRTLHYGKRLIHPDGFATAVHAFIAEGGRGCNITVPFKFEAAAHGFMSGAREHGATARDGLGMLVEQAAEAFRIWRGVLPPSQKVLAELRTVMGQA